MQLSRNLTQLSRNLGGNLSNLSGHSQLDTEAADLKDGEGITYFSDFDSIFSFNRLKFEEC